MLYHMNNTFQNTIFQIHVNVPLMKTAPFSGNRSFQWKPLPLLEAIPLSESHSWKPLLLVEDIPFSRSHSLQWKPFLFSGSHSFQWKPFLLVEAIHVYGNHCPQQKKFLLVEAILFSVSTFSLAEVIRSYLNT